jgi:hypothetical protein
MVCRGAGSIALLATLVLPMRAGAQSDSGYTALEGVCANGDLVRIDPTTGAATLDRSLGYQCDAATGSLSFGYFYYPYVYLAGGPGALADQIVEFSFWSGGTSILNTTGRPQGYAVRAMAYGGPGYYVILGSDDPSAADLLATINGSSGAYTLVGATGRTGLTSLALAGSGGPLYALGAGAGGALYRLDVQSGASELIGAGSFGDSRALAVVADGSLLACGSSLLAVDPLTGAARLIGAVGITGIRGIVAFNYRCYANCDGTGNIPTLNVQDFSCFLTKFAAGTLYANCDRSTTPPVLNVADFTCFLQRFATGCSEP